MTAAYHRPPHAVQVQPWRVVADEAAAVTITTHGFADSAPVKVSALYRIEYRAGAKHESVQLFIDDAQTRALPDERCIVTIANTRGDTVLAITGLLGHDDRGHWCAPATDADHAALAALFATGDNLRFELTAGNAQNDALPRMPFVAFVLAGSPGFDAVHAEVDARAVRASVRPAARPARHRRELRAMIAGLLRRLFPQRPRPVGAQEPVLPTEPVSDPGPPPGPGRTGVPEVAASPERLAITDNVATTEVVALTERVATAAPEIVAEPAMVTEPAVAVPAPDAPVPATATTTTSPFADTAQTTGPRRRSWFARWRTPVSEDSVIDRAAAIRRRALVAAYRRQGTRMGRAPTALTSDAAMIEVHERVTEAYAQVARERGEALTPARLHYIAWRFMETRETLGEDMLRSHLRHELRRYRADGLRPDFQRELKLDLPA